MVSEPRVTLPETVAVAGVELRRQPQSKYVVRWECVVVAEPRTRIGIESQEYLARIFRPYLTSDGGPDFNGAWCDTIEDAVAELERHLSVVRSVAAALAGVCKQGTRVADAEVSS